MNRQELKELIEKSPRGYHRTLSAPKYIDFRSKLATQYPNLKQIERYYLYAHDTNKPLCKNCGKKYTRFVNINEGYKIFCSEKCSIEWYTTHSDMTKKLKEQSKQPPECIHVHCNKPVVKNKNGLWSQFCSTKCRGIHNSLISRDKAKKTMMGNYGVEHALQSHEIREKLKQQNMKKYGYENPLSSPEIMAKTKKTMLEKYGYSSPWQDKERYQDHVDNTAAQYGHKSGKFRNVSQIPEVHEKKMKSSWTHKEYILPSGKTIKVQGYEDRFLDKALTYYDESFLSFGSSFKYEHENNIKYYFPDMSLSETKECVEIKSCYTFEADREINIAKANGVVDAENVHNVFIYVGNNEVPNTLTFSDRVRKIEQSLVGHDRAVRIGDYYVDFELNNICITIRNKNIANNIFLDNTHYLNMQRHLHLNGKKLLVIYEHEINESMLKSIAIKCGVHDDHTVYARKCVVDINPSGVYGFLEKNHVQGYVSNTVNYGLYHEEELVAVMCFNKYNRSNDSTDNDYELVRYATSAHVVGGGSKLFKRFIHEYQPNNVYSYSDNSISDGNLYEVLGFKAHKKLRPDYRYSMYGDHRILHKTNFRKAKLKERFPEIYDETLTEHQMTRMVGYYRLYDCGKITWKYSNK